MDKAQVGVMVGHGDRCGDFVWFGQIDGTWDISWLGHIDGCVKWCFL